MCRYDSKPYLLGGRLQRPSNRGDVLGIILPIPGELLIEKAISHLEGVQRESQECDP